MRKVASVVPHDASDLGFTCRIFPHVSIERASILPTKGGLKHKCQVLAIRNRAKKGSYSKI
jgi:hypothetical protein